MSDETGNGVFVLHSVSGCYAEVHISWENNTSFDIIKYLGDFLLSRIVLQYHRLFRVLLLCSEWEEVDPPQT